MSNERFAMALAKEIWNGMTPGKARSMAAGDTGLGKKEDKELRRILKVFFELKTLPKTRHQWQLIVAGWLLLHPGYTEQYLSYTGYRAAGGLTRNTFSLCKWIRTSE